MITRNRGLALLGFALSLLAAGCGAGVVGVAASSDSGGGGNSAPSIANLQVPVSKTSPAQIRFELSDREGETVQVELFARVPEVNGDLGDPRLLTLVGNAGFPANGAEVAIPGGNQIKTVAVAWEFDAEGFLLSGGSYLDDIQLIARLGSGTELVLGDDEPFSIGNDPPQVTAVTPIVDAEEDEAAGIVRVAVSVEDSSDDVVTVAPEFDVQGDVPDAGWMPATGFGLTDVQVFHDGTTLDFFWDTDADLHDLERQVVLRFTATDSAPAVGNTKESLSFRVDNNAAPIVQLDSGPLILNPDERRGIPIPFRVIDEEGDLVEVIFQWRREGEEFPSLDRDGDGKIENAEVDEILADPILRQQHHICSEYPHYAQGRVVPFDEDTVRLPELASSASWILASGIVGRTLELLRPSSILAPITPTWRSNPLLSPIAALPVGDGLTALVLDFPGNGRLREIELATGAIVREIATLGPGIPSTMAFERREKAVLVALDDAGTWRIERVELASGSITELIVSDGREPAPVRGIASLGTNAAVFTAGSSLLHLDYRDPLAPQIGRLLTDLATPWGVVVDPLPPDRIYVSERDANRALAIELDSHGKLPVVVKTEDMQLGTLEAPEALALERNGSRMLIVTSAPGGDRALLGLDLGATGGNRSFPIGGPTATDVASVATGSDGLRLLCLPTSNELLVAGGIEQRRVIAAHSTASQDAAVERPFDPVPSLGQSWRLPEEAHRLLHASAQGVVRRFVWDSTDAPTCFTFIRAKARDNEVGLAANGVAPKKLSAGLEVAPFVVGGSTTTDPPGSVAIADLDGDGALDLVRANAFANNLTIFFQLAPASFLPTPLVLGGTGTTDVPAAIVAADLDGDDDLDLVSANNAGHNLTVFFQLSPRSFATNPLVLGGMETTNGPSSAAAADFDGDGDLDLVSANSGGDNLTVFFQISPGSFAASPLALGGSGTTDGPVSVAAADLDGDGDQDIVSANAGHTFSTGGNDLTVFFQLSPGSFAATPQVLGEIEGPVSVAAADLDEDGDMDLVSANLIGNDLTVFFQLSPGSFVSTPLVLGGAGTTNRPLLVTAADVDGDGDQDLVSANNSRRNLTIFFQLGPGVFQSEPLVLGGSGTTETRFAVADIDGDGDLDIASANLSGGLTVFLQASPGSFQATPLVHGGVGTTDVPVSVAAADLDGDGDQDLVSANEEGNNLTMFLQLSPGSFQTAPLVIGGLGSPTNFPPSVAAADLDGDGDQDLVSARGENLTVFWQLPAGSFASTPLTLGFPSLTNPRSVAAADLDGDGDLDLVSANDPGRHLTIFFQLSPGGFAAEPLSLGGALPTNSERSVEAADLDGDGDQDLVSANNARHNLTVYFQQSPGTFSDVPLTLGRFPTTEGPVSVKAADLDGDGDQDLVSANLEGSNLTVFFQLAPGSFSAARLTLGGLPTMFRPFSVAAEDLDGDADIDLVSANSGSNNLTVFFQLSPGSFAASPLVLGGLGTTSGPRSVGAADLDGDGDQDLVSANAGDNNLTVFWGGR